MRGYRRYDNLKIPDLAGTVRYEISQIPVPGTYLTLYTDFTSVISGSTDRRFEIRVQPVECLRAGPAAKRTFLVNTTTSQVHRVSAS